MDELLEQEIFSDVEWISQEIPISSSKELAIGYMVGILRSVGITLSGTSKSGTYEEYDETVWSIIKRRLPEIVDKINKELQK